MTSQSRKNPIARAKQVVRGEAWWSLIHWLIPDCLSRAHSYVPSGFGNMARILAWLERHNQYDVYSFDVFDTLIRRKIDPPELIKSMAAEHLSASLARGGINVSQKEILTQRSRIEEALLREAESRGRDADYCLDDVIAGTLKAIQASDALDIREITNYEVGLEKKAAQPMPGAVEVLSYLQSTGKRFICISDSYLSASQMAAILESQGLMKYIDKLYVSCEIGKRKSTGRLFRHVLEQEGRNLVHIGDSYTSDSLIPRKLGIKALWFHSGSERARKSELKRLLYRKNKMNYVHAIVASTHRCESELHRIGYDVIGPALTVFVHNLAEEARKDGIETLFFVARDGYALKKIYEILQRNLYPGSSLPAGKYMCLGRLPVRLASLKELTLAEISEGFRYIVRSGKKNATLGDVLSSYGFDRRDLTAVARRHKIDINKLADDGACDARLSNFLNSTEFREFTGEQSAMARELLRSYLLSIGFIGKRKVAVVDANAEGLTQIILDRIFLNDVNYPVVNRYYFNALNLNADKVSPNLDLPQVKGIISDWREGTEYEQSLFFIFGMIIELFSHPYHGLTVGYRNVGGRIIPVFARTQQENQYVRTSHGLRGILSYSEDYGAYYSLHHYEPEELLKHTRINIKQWVSRPPKKDVEALKDLFLTSDWPIERSYNLVERIEARDIVTIRGLTQKHALSFWPQGTLALIPCSALRWTIYKAAAYKNNAQKLTSRLARLWPYRTRIGPKR